MERLHMNYLRDILYRLRKGESERRIALGLGPQPPKIPSSLEPYRAVVEDLM
jgi:hypothetical protein